MRDFDSSKHIPTQTVWDDACLQRKLTIKQNTPEPQPSFYVYIFIYDVII